MITIFIVLLAIIALYFYWLLDEYHFNQSDHKENKIQLKKMNYSMESSKELSSLNKLSNKPKSDSQLLISNYWRRNNSKNDTEFSRLPHDNFKIDTKSSDQKNDIEFWDLFSENKLTLLTKDTNLIYACWNIKGLNTEKTKAIIRLYDTSSKTDSNNKNYFDIEIDPYADNWYIKVPENDRIYYGEIGLLADKGIFISLAKSNSIIVPTDKPHEKFGDVWMKVDNGNKEYVNYSPKSSLNSNINKNINISSLSLLKK